MTIRLTVVIWPPGSPTRSLHRIDAGRELVWFAESPSASPRFATSAVFCCWRATNATIATKRDRADQSIDKVSYHAFSRCLSCSRWYRAERWRQSPVAGTIDKTKQSFLQAQSSQMATNHPPPRVINASSVVRSCSLKPIVIAASSFLYAVSLYSLPTGSHAISRRRQTYAASPRRSQLQKQDPKRPSRGMPHLADREAPQQQVCRRCRATCCCCSAGRQAIRSRLQLDLGRAEPTSATSTSARASRRQRRSRARAQDPSAVRVADGQQLSGARVSRHTRERRRPARSRRRPARCRRATWSSAT